MHPVDGHGRAMKVHALLIVVSVVVMRLNGSLWYWVGPNSYRRLKFDLHNRVELGFWDAKVMQYLHRPTLGRTNTLINLMSMYGVCVGVYFYYQQALARYEFHIWEWYKDSCAEVDIEIDDYTDFLECHLILERVSDDLTRATMHHICADPEWTVLVGLFHATMLLVMALLASVSGCDLLGSLSM